MGSHSNFIIYLFFIIIRHRYLEYSDVLGIVQNNETYFQQLKSSWRTAQIFHFMMGLSVYAGNDQNPSGGKKSIITTSLPFKTL